MYHRDTTLPQEMKSVNVVYDIKVQLYKSLKIMTKSRWELGCLAVASLWVSTLGKYHLLHDLLGPFVVMPKNRIQCGLYPSKEKKKSLLKPDKQGCIHLMKTVLLDKSQIMLYVNLYIDNTINLLLKLGQQKTWTKIKAKASDKRAGSIETWYEPEGV